MGVHKLQEYTISIHARTRICRMKQFGLKLRGERVKKIENQIVKGLINICSKCKGGGKHGKRVGSQITTQKQN